MKLRSLLLAAGCVMSVSKLTQELENMPPHEPFDWIGFSARVNEEFGAEATSEARGELLAARAAAMEFVIRQLELHGDHLADWNFKRRG